MAGVPTTLAWARWRFAASTAVAGIAACWFVSFVLPGLLGYHQWLVPGDAWTTIGAAQWASAGAVGSVYSQSPWYDVLPGFITLIAPLVSVGDHLGLVMGFPHPLAYPSMWKLLGPAFFVCGGTCTLAVDYLAESLGVTVRRRRALAVTVGALIVVPTAGYPAGHPEDLVALALVCLSLALAGRGRLYGAAIVLSLAVMTQTWAGLLVPALVAYSPAGRGIGTAARATLLPGLVAALLLCLDFQHAGTNLLGQALAAGKGQRLPWWYLARHASVHVGNRVIPAVAGSTTRWLAVVVACAAAVVVRRRPSPAALVAAAGVALWARGVFEAEYWPYYLAPATALMLVLCVSTTEGRGRRWLAGWAGAILLYINAPFSYFVYHRLQLPPALALAVLVSSGGLAMAASMPAWRQRRTRRHTSVAPPAAAPITAPHALAGRPTSTTANGAVGA